MLIDIQLLSEEKASSYERGCRIQEEKSESESAERGKIQDGTETGCIEIQELIGLEQWVIFSADSFYKDKNKLTPYQ